MSEFIRTLNLIKAKRSATWLTDSQQAALAALRNILRIPCAVNLYGASGVGKTFLGWHLADEFRYAYFPHLDLFVKTEHMDAPGVVVDNCRPDRQHHRETLKMLGFRGIHHSILISREPIRDYVHCVELGLTANDITRVRDNLMTIGISRDVQAPGHLLYLVNPGLMAFADS